MSKKSLVYVLGILALIVGFYACEREDAEPVLDMREFTRLYISFEEYRPPHQRPPADTNLRIVYPADSSVFAFNGRHESPIQGGGVVYFAPELNAIFHASVNRAGANDTAISVLNVGSSGSVTTVGTMRSRYYNSVRGLAYHQATNVLFAVNGTGPNAGIYVIDRPRFANNEKQPLKKLRNNSLNMWGAAYSDNKLFTSKTSAPAGIYVFEDITTIPVRESDSVAALNYANIMEIEGAGSLRGLFYDTVKNVMAVADASGDAGRILIFENFSSLINDETITPTRIIAGANTGLIRPDDVVIDTREEGVYLYVADRASRKISRFRYTDDGDVEPDQVIDASGLQYGRTPGSLTLDTRR